MYKLINVTLIFISCMTQIAHSAPCSSACESAFVSNCFDFQCRKDTINSGADAYAACIEEIGTSGPLKNKCEASCTVTAAMKTKESEDCDSGSSNTGGNGNGGNGGNTPGSFCDDTVTITGKPTEPTLCTDRNAAVVVYTFWPMTGSNANTQRYFSILNFPSTTLTKKLPVMIQIKGYGGDGILRNGGAGKEAAEYYKFAYLQMASPFKDGGGKFGLEFGADNVANDQNPMPCDDSQSRDLPYMRKIINWIENQDQLDKTKIYSRGFSQNSMFAVYMAVCFADKFAGVWQGGSGLALTGQTPIVPGAQAQCKLSDALADGGTQQCCQKHFCSECKYWPLYPKTCAVSKPKRKLIDCIMSYTNDGIACGTDKYMYDAMAREGNDARMLSFSPSSGVSGGHSNPQNDWAWVAGCLGISTSCSSQCETSFVACAGGTTSPAQFKTCETNLKNGALSGCVIGCSATVTMLKISETPVITLTEGKFGTNTNLVAAGKGPAPNPICTRKVNGEEVSNPFGSFADTSSGCNPPQGTVFPDFNVYPSDDICEQANSGGASDSASPTPGGASDSGSPTPGGGGAPITGNAKKLDIFVGMALLVVVVTALL